MLLGDKGTAISKGEGFANYSSIQTFHGAFTNKDRYVLFTVQLVVTGRHRKSKPTSFVFLFCNCLNCSLPESIAAETLVSLRYPFGSRYA